MALSFRQPAAIWENATMENLKVTAGIEQSHLEAVYSDSGVKRCGYNGREPSPVIHPLATYLSAWIGDKFAGAFLAVRQSQHDIELHALLLRDSVRQSRQLSIQAVDWCFAQGINRVTALIVEGLEKTVNLCRKIGFTYEGLRRESVMVDGRMVGIHMMGVTRAEWSTK